MLFIRPKISETFQPGERLTDVKLKKDSPSNLAINAFSTLADNPFSNSVGILKIKRGRSMGNDLSS